MATSTDERRETQIAIRLDRVGKYNVKTNAAGATASMRSSFVGLRLALLVGVCGGMPRTRDGEVLLGDVIISKTVIQYDFGCADDHLIARKRLQAEQRPDQHGRDATPQPVVHIGAVASGDTVMKSAADRDSLSRGADVIAFEMEGAGVWDEVPCIVVKGVCDYADSHKHKGWQNFAAATAASASKAILERYIQTDGARFRSSHNASVASIPQQDGAAQVVHGPVFHGPITGSYVIAGPQVTGGNANFNFGH
ncbi:hypothetical protein MKZ38_004386 [Zalerion maritima]|uniref:Nucleoside phosphorylase domain-containing protein n=1 Tax=Zalerion maritima TaxID=339359 RepID=A0AAD5RMR4_9PEZI|nr:hypothetical protein MKZ38_004386 [Zalerion maritima]